MRRLFTLFLLSCAGLLSAQQVTQYPLREAVDSARFEVVVAASGHGLALRWLGSEVVTTSKAELLPIRSLQLVDADLVLNFNTLGVPKGFSYRIFTSLRQEGRTVYSNFWSSPGTTTSDKAVDQEIVVGEDATERILELGQTYVVVLRRQLLGTLNCAAGRPDSPKHPWLPIGYAYAGAGALALSAVPYGLAKQDYDRYRTDWTTGETREATQPFLDRANRNRTIGHVVAGAGAALIVLDVWLKSRQVRRIRQQQSLYDEYCTPPAATPRTSWHLEPTPTGVGLVCRF